MFRIVDPWNGGSLNVVLPLRKKGWDSTRRRKPWN
jgi:hypothetical protein